GATHPPRRLAERPEDREAEVNGPRPAGVVQEADHLPARAVGVDRLDDVEDVVGVAAGADDDELFHVAPQEARERWRGVVSRSSTWACSRSVIEPYNGRRITASRACSECGSRAGGRSPHAGSWWEFMMPRRVQMPCCNSACIKSSRV